VHAFPLIRFIVERSWLCVEQSGTLCPLRRESNPAAKAGLPDFARKRSPGMRLAESNLSPRSVGVGKTYAILNEGRRRKEYGEDVMGYRFEPSDVSR
jgi:hypothetical protein